MNKHVYTVQRHGRRFRTVQTESDIVGIVQLCHMISAITEQGQSEKTSVTDCDQHLQSYWYIDSSVLVKILHADIFSEQVSTL